jgi:hypothetical protein
MTKKERQQITFEPDHSMTINDLHDVSGTPRKLNVHAYRCAAAPVAGLNLSILSENGAYLASVHLDKWDIEQLLQQIIQLI